MLLYRKDRVVQISGGDLLWQPMVMDFTKGHWLSFYMRVMTEDRPAGATLPGEVPIYPKRSARFMWKLLLAWGAMGFRRPRLPW
jgi:hypothetical protein